MLKLLSFISLLGLAIFLVLIDYTPAMANDIGPLSVQTIAGGIVVIIGLGGVILKRVGKTSDPDIKSKVRKTLKDMRGDGR
ncbi:MAG: hypothetical protein A2611_04230 [Candidatus Komeilibacteria bacterium RIFOXYD1_FULL_37_29]|nr:MAG: hypothetical protein A2611_04230 [Candidatus Komeilibacteria bacterium RIFOXYD1_FULL_37_29]